MPTYEYVCEACQAAWESDQRISDPPLVDCPTCGRPDAKRLISGSGAFVLKGKGWFKTDYPSPIKKH